MKKVKSKNIGAILFACLLMVMGTVYFALLGNTNTVTAKADMAHVANFYMGFSYEWEQIIRKDTEDVKNQISEKNVYAAQVLSGKDTYCDVAVEIYTNLFASETVNLPIVNGFVKSSEVQIKVIAEFSESLIEVIDSNGLSVSVAHDNKIMLKNLADGKYDIKIRLTKEKWKNDEGCDTSIVMSLIGAIILDNTAPQIIGAGTSVVSQYKNRECTIIAEDNLSGVENLYKKSPQDSNYVAVGTSYTLYENNENGLYRFYAKDNAGNISSTYYIYLDTVKPIGVLYADEEKVENNNIVDAPFIKYVAADLQSGIRTVYVKKPGATSYITTANGSRFTQEGQYSFYCEDKAGNKSDIVNIILDNSLPSGRIVKSETDNKVYFTWDNDLWTATLNGTRYVKNTWIAAEGDYIVVLANSVGKEATYTFTIDHYFVKQEEVLPTCTQNGYDLYACVSCDLTRKEHIKVALGHDFITTTTLPSCTESGTVKHTCKRCDYIYVREDVLPSGHEYISEIVCAANCTEHGKRHFICKKCGYEYDEYIQPCGHNYEITAIEQVNDETRRTYTCTVCGDSYTQDMGNQYEKVSNYVEYLFRLYKPYMVWVFIATAGVWSITLGIMIILAHKNEEKEKARKMLVNYIVGMLVIFGIVVACPFLVRGIAYLVT